MRDGGATPPLLAFGALTMRLMEQLLSDKSLGHGSPSLHAITGLVPVTHAEPLRNMIPRRRNGSAWMAVTSTAMIRSR